MEQKVTDSYEDRLLKKYGGDRTVGPNKRSYGGYVIAALVLALVVGTAALLDCQERARSLAPVAAAAVKPISSAAPVSPPLPTAEQERAAIGVSLNGYVRALSKLPQSREPESVLQYLTPDAIGIQDGRPYTRDEIAAGMARQVGIYSSGDFRALVKIDSPQIALAGNLASVRYASSFQLTKGAAPVESKAGYCTQTWQKLEGHWLISCEHCSQVHDSEAELIGQVFKGLIR